MLNITMLKRDWKANWRLFAFFTLLLIGITGITLFFYDPLTGMKSMTLIEWMPENLIRVCGINLLDSSLTGYISSFLFGLPYLVIPMCYVWILTNRLVAEPVETKMMSFYLSVPQKREQLIFTQIYALWMSLFFMFLCTGIFGLLWCSIWFPGMLEIPQFLLLFIGCLFLHFCIGSICFLASCLCDEVKTSVMIGGGITLLFLLLHLLSRIGGDLQYLKFITVFSLFETEEILEGAVVIYWKLPLAVTLAGVFCILGKKVFGRKDLPL